jgi:hypothetical protein
MKEFQLEIVTDTASDINFSQRMVEETDLGPSIFPESSSHYALGIGAQVADDCGGFSRGIALEHPKGFALV